MLDHNRSSGGVAKFGPGSTRADEREQFTTD